MKIIPFNIKGEYDTESRFAIADDSGAVVDDAQGYGYKTAEKAHKAMWYKFQGGKKKIQTNKSGRRKFFKEHPGLEEAIENMLENNFGELARGEYTDQDFLDWIKEEFQVDMPKEYIRE